MEKKVAEMNAEKVEKAENLFPPPPSYSELEETIIKQPGQHAAPTQQPSVPELAGLEHLVETEAIVFKQELHIAQLVCGCDMPINFDLIDENDRIIYQIQEQEDFCARNCMPQGLRTESNMVKTNGLIALRFRRETRCVMNCCLPCCCYPLPFSRERLTVSSGIGMVYGTVQHDWSAWRSRFSVLNKEGSVVLKIEGPGCNFGFFGDLHYKIVTPGGEVIGSIVKQWSGLLCEVVNDFDNFTLNFPRDLDVPVKATLIGAVKLINFLFFQGSLRRLIVGVTYGCCKAIAQPVH
ncbi:phospholipid scramblase 2-like [Toxorhynchites rutilus septentrionalis]|uniref:phospholipid scramblase 2-like n=1 Tax=Toxorhynchites rutilus septentrionalis TaxID=329112 RepID=UPI00247A07F2|nr:phospholipid scramblase 2-like [Toxorhynchites rutilus septentrionalis]